VTGYPPAEPRHTAAETRSALVVEDDQVTRAFLVDNLTADGFPAAGASGAGEGFANGPPPRRC
jgi:hypothetical protein